MDTLPQAIDPWDPLDPAIAQAVQALRHAAQSMQTTTAQEPLSNELIDLFNAASELCRLMRQAAWRNSTATGRNAGIRKARSLC